MDCTCLVNRKYRLKRDDIPEFLVEPDILFDAPEGDCRRMLAFSAARAAEKLFRSGREQGMLLYGISGYRSFERQEKLYRERLKKAFREYVESHLAPPGASEHQTGLALDVSCPGAGLELTEKFADTKEGRWLVANAPLFGFIIRYPRGKEEITGYAWEPWHIRYVTKSLALYLSLTGLTLEEYHSHP